MSSTTPRSLELQDLRITTPVSLHLDLHVCTWHSVYSYTICMFMGVVNIF